MAEVTDEDRRRAQQAMAEEFATGRDAVAAALAEERERAREPFLRLAAELEAEHKPGCCAGGDCLLGGEHTHPDDPILASELVGIFSDNPPPMREHRMIPCPRECDCGAVTRANRIRHAAEDGQ